MRDIFAKRYRDRFEGRLAYVDVTVLPYFHNNYSFITILGYGPLTCCASKDRSCWVKTNDYMTLAPFFSRQNY
jgi:hypothetical protein